ncbi:uncharacterized protein LOC118356149 [Zalophus californianus]|uniref:Uncharacterized protein LOC118356149 n=1 Tax=Zalophus californianus TaxID=9704 RepID=A0A6P9F0C2_ZALCA|nr:uncharacterized protein LOC118356149 [Zalophus californianus]
MDAGAGTGWLAAEWQAGRMGSRMEMPTFSRCLRYRRTVNVFLSELLHVPVRFCDLPSEQPGSANTDTEEKNCWRILMQGSVIVWKHDHVCESTRRRLKQQGNFSHSSRKIIFPSL